MKSGEDTYEYKIIDENFGIMPTSSKKDKPAFREQLGAVMRGAFS